MSFPSFINNINEGDSQKSLSNLDNQMSNYKEKNHSRKLSELPPKPFDYNKPFLLNESS